MVLEEVNVLHVCAMLCVCARARARMGVHKLSKNVGATSKW
jgi:hypothetical protein